MDRETQLRSLRHHFVERQYPPEQVDIQIDKAREIERDNLLKYKEKKRNNRVPFVVTYSPFLKGIGTILHKHLPLLHNSPKLKQIFPEPPLTAFRRPPNLRDLLVHAKVTPPTTGEDPPGAFKCLKKCIVCTFIHTSTKFTSTVTGESFPISSNLSCKTNWLIYLITCKRCSKQYVGKTETTLYTRFNNTRSEIKNKKERGGKSLPYVTHFNAGQHTVNDISLLPIEKIHKQDRSVILRRESFWIAKLRTLSLPELMRTNNRLLAHALLRSHILLARFRSQCFDQPLQAQRTKCSCVFRWLSSPFCTGFFIICGLIM